MTLNSNATGSDNFEFKGYFRSGTATSSLGGDQECFNNVGSSGNEFRLGNECDAFGSVKFRAYQLRDKESKKYFYAHYTMEFGPEAHSISDANKDFKVVELYIEGGNLFKKEGMSYWIGKRHYRDVDLHMLDFFYYAAMSGNGGGIKNIKTRYGDIAIAQLREVGSTDTSIGKRGSTVWDFRLTDSKISKNSKMNYWLGYAEAKATGNSDSKDHKANGYVVGLRLNTQFKKGHNNLSVIYGDGLLAPQKLSSPDDANEEAKSLRFVEELSLSLSSAWEIQLGAVYEKKETGTNTNNKNHWISMGARPVYFINDHFSIATEVGHSIVKNDVNDRTTRRLTRLTIAPQISIDRGQFARPTLRAFYTKSFWNDENKTSVGIAAPSFINKTSGASYGLQGEIWF